MSCPTGWRYQSQTTGKVFLERCGSWKCLTCGPFKAQDVMKLASWSGMVRAVELTLVGDDWPTIRNRVKRCVYRVRKAGYPWDVVWCVEPNPAETGNHVHGLFGPSYVPRAVVRDAAVREGLGERTWLRADDSDLAGDYASKLGRYAAKSAAAGVSDYERALTVNGGRLVHWTRRPFGGLSYPDARKKRSQSRPSHDPGPWVRERCPGPMYALEDDHQAQRALEHGLTSEW